MTAATGRKASRSSCNADLPSGNERSWREFRPHHLADGREIGEDGKDDGGDEKEDVTFIVER